MWTTIWLLSLCCLSLAVIWFDLRQRRVPNRLLAWALGWQGLWLLGSTVVGSTVAAPWDGVMMTRWAPALLGAGVALFVLFPLWRFKAMGAGDVKFAACLGLYMGWWGLLQAFVLASLLAGAHAVAFYAWRLLPAGVRPFGIPYIPRSTPYAAYLAFGVLFGLGWQALHGAPWLWGLMGRP